MMKECPLAASLGPSDLAIHPVAIHPVAPPTPTPMPMPTPPVRRSLREVRLLGLPPQPPQDLSRCDVPGASLRREGRHYRIAARTQAFADQPAASSSSETPAINNMYAPVYLHLRCGEPEPESREAVKRR